MALELQTDVAMYLRPRLQASNERIIDLWLSRKAEKTQKAYLRDIGQFLDFVGYKHVNEITLPDIVDFLNDLDHLAESTQARKIAAIKSLLAFAYKAGFTVVNVGAAVESISVPNELTDRILTETEVFRMIEYTKKPRDKALIRFLYSTAVRVEEAHEIRWKHISDGVLTVKGKGGKNRFLKLTEETLEVLESIRPEDWEPEDPVFISQKGNPLSTRRMWEIVKLAGQRAGIKKDVSPHFMRHSHATHALERGAPIHLVQAQLGHASLTTTSKYTHVRPDDTSSRYLAI